jgi:hypothetical protein
MGWVKVVLEGRATEAATTVAARATGAEVGLSVKVEVEKEEAALEEVALEAAA